MSTVLFVIIGVGSIVSFIVSLLSSPAVPQPPTIIVHIVAPRRSIGCLPFVAGIIVTLVVLNILAGA